MDIQISLTFRHLCSMPNLIYECYTASLLYRSKLYVIRTIFIIFHICAILPFPELHLTEMVCFQCFSYFVQILRIYVWRFFNRDRHPAFFVLLYHNRRWTGSGTIFWKNGCYWKWPKSCVIDFRWFWTWDKIFVQLALRRYVWITVIIHKQWERILDINVKYTNFQCKI